MRQFYNGRQGTLLGVPTTWLFIGIAVLLFVILRRIKQPLDAINGVTSSASSFLGGIFDTLKPGASNEEQQQNQINKQSANDTLKKSVSFGQPTATDKAKADQLYNFMDGYFNQSKVIDLFGKITGKYEMNRIYTAFGVRTIVHGGIPFFRKKVEGDLIAHLTAYGIDLDKKHQRSDGSYFTIKIMLNHIGG